MWGLFIMDVVELKFSLICECDSGCCDDVGEDICHDMMGLYSNGEDVYEWLFRGFEVIKKA